MTFPWILRLAREDFASLAALRLQPGLELAEDAAHLWLRGPSAEGPLAAALAALPALDRYERVDESRLRRVDSRIPSVTAPRLVWQPLSQWLGVTPWVGFTNRRNLWAELASSATLFASTPG